MDQPQPSGLLAALEARGCSVDVIDPDANAYTMGDDTWLYHLDVIVCRGRSVGALALLRWAEIRGVRCINRRQAIEYVLNKAQMGIALQAGGVRVPASWLGPVTALATGIPASSYPLMLKPVFGDNCLGLRIVSTPEEMSTTSWPEPVALAQALVPNEGDDLKLYGIGEHVWAVQKRSCLSGAGGRPTAPGTDASSIL